MAQNTAASFEQHQKEFIQLISLNSRRFRKHEVFRDFCELAALSLSNAVDLNQRSKREERYLHLISRYEPTEVERFPIMLAHVTMALELGFHDCLGQLFMRLELSDHWKGQYFTPYPIAYLMAQLTIGSAHEKIQTVGYITVNEPAAGAGAMLIGMAQALLDSGQNYQQVLHVTAQDIDETAVHMCYIQLALLHVPGIVIQGNSLAVEERSHWYTPAHILGGWSMKLRQVKVVENLEQELHSELSAPVLQDARKIIPAVQPVFQLDLFA